VFRKKNVHSTKAHRYISFMIMSNPSKSGKVVTFPKWGIVLILVLLIGSGYGIAKVTAYVGDLKYSTEVAKQEEGIAHKTNDEKQEYIESLEQTTSEQEIKLQEVQGQAEQILEQIEKIKEMKEDIDEKLGNDGASIDKDEVATTNTLDTSNAVAALKVTPRNIELTTLSAGGNATGITNFDVEYDNLKSMLNEYTEALEFEYEEYDERNNQVDELLPYLAAKPTGYPLDSTYITSAFGNRKSPFNRRRTEFHSGIDLKAYYKQDVMSTGKGTVISAKYDGTYGYCIVIDHGYGLKTRYAHNSKILAKVGTVVERGTVIARAGSTGRSTGTHLHYEVLVNGVAVNPEDYLN
jgi:murein DD-endopeptidase MepM/ murein hydrolase activator NlpD